MLHLVALRRTGSNNPDGIEIKERTGADGKPLDGIPFHPYYTVKDIVGVGVFFIIFALIVFYVPTVHGLFLEQPNFEPANPLSTPAEIHPVWYFTPYYAILRAVPNKGMGALLMLLALVSLLVLPWLDRSPVKSIRYKGWISRVMLAVFVDLLRRAGVPGSAARGGSVRHPGAHLRGLLLRLLLADAVLLAHRPGEAGAGESGLPCPLALP